MKNRSFRKNPGWLAATAGLLLFLLNAGLAATEKPIVPVVDGHLGACSANFTVLDAAKKPLYDAKVNVVIRYGLMGARKIELQVATNSEGKARVAGLPEKPKKPLEFEIVNGSASRKLMVDTAVKCDGMYEVILEAK